MKEAPVLPPRIGMLATVRNRRGIITSVEPFGGTGRENIHLATVEYLDSDGPREDILLWEREQRARLLEPTALPDPSRENPMPCDEFDALVRATRWTALSPFFSPDGETGAPEGKPLAAPFHGAIQLDDFQLVPLLTALRMPRIALLLADDVGLGKTIQAGLILSELLLRRRIRRVLILCPASLRLQWKQEMHEKFCISFDIIDRAATHAIQRKLGLDANPWRTAPKIIASYDYLKQPDVLEQFRAACRIPEGSPHLPWDLLVVDEAHNLCPASFGQDSELSHMLKAITPWFEHRLFLTATPHNGHTRSFTGLLEYLDPVRFTRKSEPFTPAERDRAKKVVIRRLKSEINARTTPPRFPQRTPKELHLTLSVQEKSLSAAFSSFRLRVRTVFSSSGRKEELTGKFAVEVLAKRLLSAPVTFADSWMRYKEGIEVEEQAEVREVLAAERSAREETGDDCESESRISHAARIVGAWLKPLAARLASEIAGIDKALEALGLGREEFKPGTSIPVHDTRFDTLCDLISERLHDESGQFRDDERLVVFTEYKTTLDYLASRLRLKYPGDGLIQTLFGHMDEDKREGEDKRESVKRAFNDPCAPVRILVATDAASEGLNLQSMARYLLHYDIPWNPARLEQRNGRLDRHGQAREVTVHHFTTDDDDDLRFLSYVAGKVHTIREELGSFGDVFDSAFEHRLISGEALDEVRSNLESQLASARGRTEFPREDKVGEEGTSTADLEKLSESLDIDPEALKMTLDVAMGVDAGRPRLDGPDGRGRFRFVPPIPAKWEDLVDASLRLDASGGRKGPIPGILFDSHKLIRIIGGRPIFRPERDTALLHLGHPMFQRAFATFARARFPGQGAATRWTIRNAAIPVKADALILLTVEELAVNELRETLHHWVRTFQLPVIVGELRDPLPPVSPKHLRAPNGSALCARDVSRARDVWDSVSDEVRHYVDDLASTLTSRLKTALEAAKSEAVRRENERFRSRQGEISVLIQENTVKRLEREIVELRADAMQGYLFDPEDRLAEIERSIAEKEEEIRRRTAHYEELREQLQQEQDRTTRYLIPARYSLRGAAQVFPVAIEIRLPGVAQ